MSGVSGLWCQCYGLKIGAENVMGTVLKEIMQRIQGRGDVEGKGQRLVVIGELFQKVEQTMLDIHCFMIFKLSDEFLKF